MMDITAIPVSYTHLDVYKRQLDNPSTSKFKCIVRILAALNELKKQELQTNLSLIHI